MRKFILVLLTAITVIFGAVSCSDSDIDVPAGLQIIKASEEDGYIFFGPEGWIVANDGDIAAAYVSKINNTSVTFTEAKYPAGTFEEYFNGEKENFAYEIDLLESAKTTFGNAEQAHRFVYTFEYEEKDLAVMQILVKNAGSFYIFTYTSYFTNFDSILDEGSEYQIYLESVMLAIESFKFTEKTPAAEKPVPEADADGYVLASDRAISGFDLYVPKECDVTMSSTQVLVKFSDKANINITKATSTGVGIIEYLRTRKSELEQFFGDVNDIKIELAVEPSADESAIEELFKPFDVKPTVNEDLVLGDLAKGTLIVYEYTYDHNGNNYHIYQILGVNSYNGYVLTYTATEDEYSNHLDTLRMILEKVKF